MYKHSHIKWQHFVWSRTSNEQPWTMCFSVLHTAHPRSPRFTFSCSPMWLKLEKLGKHWRLISGQGKAGCHKETVSKSKSNVRYLKQISQSSFHFKTKCALIIYYNLIIDFFLIISIHHTFDSIFFNSLHCGGLCSSELLSRKENAVYTRGPTILQIHDFKFWGHDSVGF